MSAATPAEIWWWADNTWWWETDDGNLFCLDPALPLVEPPARPYLTGVEISLEVQQ